MGWEDRKGRSYLYYKRRRGGRVVSEYVGAGPLAELRELLRTEQEAAQAADCEQARAAQAAQRAVDTQLDNYSVMASALSAAALLASGYHRHKGQWRRVRYGRLDT